ncbi:Wadjet anti-phage system protein JetD domain-containing protein [Azospirillum palustre]|uniref:Wadjet anti-phage system protein JetD domain-containing protein n=1 Tax=Azospirillum palustre TaxID=2044885 RepID=UPI00137A52B9|nr:Wadjet anti-phage system protein JetD domain-containing protein [Azospirillum palustre]
MLLRGSLCLPGGKLLDGRPYVGVPPEWLETLAVAGRPEYFLVIENLASFNRHVREVEDSSIVLYSGGFPALATLKAIRRMDALLPADVPFFHWGDIDADGVRILQHIARSIDRPLRPHLMGVDAWSDAAVDELCRHLADPAFVPMEQEELDPQSPLAGTPAQWQ